MGAGRTMPPPQTKHRSAGMVRLRTPMGWLVGVTEEESGLP